MKNEYEIIPHTSLSHVNIFIVNLSYRTAHLHSSFEICYVLSGAVKVLTKSDTQVYRKNQFFIFNPGMVHEIKSEEAESSMVLSIQISSRFCRSYFPTLKNIEFTDTNLSQSLDLYGYQKLSQIINNIAISYFYQKPFYELNCMGQINELFCFLLNHISYQVLSEDTQKIQVAKMDRLNRMIEYIDDHFTEKLSLLDLAKKEALSSSYLSHFISENLGMSYQQYVNSLRFEKAIILLQDTQMPILDICFECGFSDPKYLKKMMNLRFGLNTKDFREKFSQKMSPENKIQNNSRQRILSMEESKRWFSNDPLQSICTVSCPRT